LSLLVNEVVCSCVALVILQFILLVLALVAESYYQLGIFLTVTLVLGCGYNGAKYRTKRNIGCFSAWALFIGVLSIMEVLIDFQGFITWNSLGHITCSYEQDSSVSAGKCCCLLGADLFLLAEPAREMCLLQ
jgi:hypothetical protein